MLNWCACFLANQHALCNISKLNCVFQLLHDVTDEHIFESANFIIYALRQFKITFRSWIHIVCVFIWSTSTCDVHVVTLHDQIMPLCFFNCCMFYTYTYATVEECITERAKSRDNKQENWGVSTIHQCKTQFWVRNDGSESRKVKRRVHNRGTNIEAQSVVRHNVIMVYILHNLGWMLIVNWVGDT
jgi:hypothetical protein